MRILHCQIYKWKQNFHFMKDTLECLYSTLSSGHLLPQTLCQPISKDLPTRKTHDVSSRRTSESHHTQWVQHRISLCKWTHCDAYKVLRYFTSFCLHVCLYPRGHRSRQETGAQDSTLYSPQTSRKIIYLTQLSFGLKTSRDQASRHGFHEIHMKLVCSKLTDS